MASISTSHSGSASAATPTRVLAGGVPFAKKGARASPMMILVFRFIVHDIGGDLHDIGVACPGGREGKTHIAHRLRCLCGQVAGTDERTPLVNRHLPCRIDRARPRGDDYVRERRVRQKSFWAGMFECAHVSDSFDIG